MFVFVVFQFRYKRRVYTQTHLDEKQLSKLHTKVRPNSCALCHPELSRAYALCNLLNWVSDTYEVHKTLLNHCSDGMVAKWLQQVQGGSGFVLYSNLHKMLKKRTSHIAGLLVCLLVHSCVSELLFLGHAELRALPKDNVCSYARQHGRCHTDMNLIRFVPLC